MLLSEEFSDVQFTSILLENEQVWGNEIIQSHKNRSKNWNVAPSTLHIPPKSLL